MSGSKNNGQDEREVFFGMIFCAMAIVRSDRLVLGNYNPTQKKKSSENEKEREKLKQIIRIIEALHALAHMKSFLGEVAHQILASYFELIPKDIFVEHILPLFTGTLQQELEDWTADFLIIAIKMTTKFSLELADFTTIFKKGALTSSTNLNVIFEILKKPKMYSTGRKLHSAWATSVSLLFPSDGTVLVRSVHTLWSLIESELFQTSANMLSYGLPLFELFLRSLPDNVHVPLVLSSNTVLSIVTGLKSKAENLRTRALKVLDNILAICSEKGSAFSLSVLLMLTSIPHVQLDALAKRTRPVATLLHNLDAEGVAQLRPYLVRLFYSGQRTTTLTGNYRIKGVKQKLVDNVPKDKKKSEADQSRMLAASFLTILCKSNPDGTSDDFLCWLLRFFFFHGFFKFIPGASVKALKKSAAKFLRSSGLIAATTEPLTLPHEQLSDRIVAFCTTKFFSLLGWSFKKKHVVSAKRMSLVSEGEDIVLEGIAADGQLYIRKVVDFEHNLNTKLSSCVSARTEQPEEVQLVRKAIMNFVNVSLCKPLTVKDKGERLKCKVRDTALELLALYFYVTFFQADVDLDSVASVLEIMDCYTNVRELVQKNNNNTQTPKKKKKKKGKNKNKKETETNNNQEAQNESLVVLVDALVGLLTLPSASMRETVRVVFKRFCRDIPEEAFHTLLDIVCKNQSDLVESIPMENGGAPMQVDDNSDEEETAMMQQDKKESDDDDEESSGSSDENDGRAIEIPDATDADMFMIDKHLAAIFREKRNQIQAEKLMKRSTMEFKIRVVDLIEEYITTHQDEMIFFRGTNVLLQFVRDSSQSDTEYLPLKRRVMKLLHGLNKTPPKQLKATYTPAEAAEIVKDHLLPCAKYIALGHAGRTNLKIQEFAKNHLLFALKILRTHCGVNYHLDADATALFENLAKKFMLRANVALTANLFLSVATKYPPLAEVFLSGFLKGTEKGLKKVKIYRVIGFFTFLAGILREAEHEPLLKKFLPQICKTLDDSLSLAGIALPKNLYAALAVVKQITSVIGKKLTLQHMKENSNIVNELARLYHMDRYRKSQKVRNNIQSFFASLDLDVDAITPPPTKTTAAPTATETPTAKNCNAAKGQKKETKEEKEKKRRRTETQEN
eukprot:TRINITY_DN1303_c0_g1_i2.p1 TRINITY_DN1303_c0_g1~~TRINITY_DN1303_c0_g1_i2.p1  ORF type:complete len:1267 (-),score=295.06 TRINITY_DN1303_c0_g1_i2:62-3445(-)